ncbi:MAG: ATP-binding protein [Synechococcales bacterium]|nr:ATP-binding protein [Synechococcales bacterium]
MSGLSSSFHPIHQARQLSAIVVNVSGRQRMLCQRIVFLAYRLVSSRTAEERSQVKAALSAATDLMERSHNGLLFGDISLRLPGKPSAEIQALYFAPPTDLDRQVRSFIQRVMALLETPDEQLNLDNPDLQKLSDMATSSLLEGLEEVVAAYTEEAEAEQTGIDFQLVTLYHQSAEAAEEAAQQTRKLQGVLRELYDAQSQLIHAEKMSSLGQLVAGVAHEINNPVNFIRGNLDHLSQYVHQLLALLQKYQDTYIEPPSPLQQYEKAIDLPFIQEDLPKVLASLKVGSDRISQLVLSLRNFSRLDEAAYKPANLHEGLESTLLILKHRLKATGELPAIQVCKHYGDLPLVTCFAGQMNQVFMNLLSNAIDAVEEQQRYSLRSGQSTHYQPKIEIETTQVEQNILVRIKDNGVGIAAQLCDRIFDPFFTTKPVGKGTGLGLAICDQIVRAHQGTLRCICAPDPGQTGTEFQVVLPIEFSGTVSASPRSMGISTIAGSRLLQSEVA